MDPLSALSLATCIAQFIGFVKTCLVDRWYVHYMHVGAYCSTNEILHRGSEA